jgi:hypothetical protein
MMSVFCQQKFSLDEHVIPANLLRPQPHRHKIRQLFCEDHTMTDFDEMTNCANFIKDALSPRVALPVIEQAI